MSTSTTVEELQRLLADLMRCVTTLHATQGDTPALRRIVNDAHGIGNGIRRLQIDAEDLGLTAAAAPCARALPMIQISDTDYDLEFWRDVDHEGVGTQGLAC